MLSLVGDTIDMQDLKDLKRRFSQIERSRGTGPRATGPEGVLLAMRRFGIRRSRTTIFLFNF